MIYNNKTLLENLTSPVREIGARVEVYNTSGSVIYQIEEDENLKNFKIEKVAQDGKFFGFGVSQKLTLTLSDKERSYTINDDYYIELTFLVGNTGYYAAPYFYIDSVSRDENTNDLTITAYDLLYKNASKFKLSDIDIELNYTLSDLAKSCADKIGATNIKSDFDDISYPEGANFDGSETIRSVLDDLAEVSQSIYYINYANALVFKRLNNNSSINFSVSKDIMFTLKTGDTYTLTSITSTTELGDNITSSTGGTGETAYIRDNPLWNLREDRATLVDNAIADIGGLKMTEFSCEWRGITDLEVGDKLSFTLKDDTSIIGYVINDTLEYDGGLKQTTSWSYTKDNEETESNPTSLGEVLNQTYAKVDKVNKQIEIVASETSTNSEAISSLQVDTSSISASVKSIQETTETSIESINNDISTLTNQVETAMTSEQVSIKIQEELENGIDKVTTSTGFTFNEEGLTVSKSDSEMKTTITEDGMTVYKNDEAVLTANNVGVDAVNLHATTYLIIGNNSRFEDYTTNRTGCFWIGG